MATAVVTRPQTSVQIVDRRLTCEGIRYTFSDQHVATFTTSGQFVGCTCGLYHYSIACAHRRLGQAQEDAYQLEAQRREEFVTACSIY